MVVPGLVKVGFLLVLLVGLLPLHNLLHALFYPPFHHAEVLFGIDLLDHLVLHLGADEGDLLDDGLLRLLAFDAGVEAVARPGGLVGQGHEERVGVLTYLVHLRDVL